LSAGPGDLIGVGGDLAPQTVLNAYANGLFPMHVNDGSGGQVLGWWSPDPRGIIPLDGLRRSRSLRQSARRFEIRVNTAFEAVIDACGDPDRPGAWINSEIRAAYMRLHRLGYAHSIEAWDRAGGTLGGGLYGICLGGFFAGESMFHHARDASKVALAGLVEILAADGDRRRLLDVQWVTEHLASLGAVEIARDDYLDRLEAALPLEPPPVFGPPR
jgi:leucyl/phenylalanyl-tRNA--protein transferase